MIYLLGSAIFNTAVTYYDKIGINKKMSKAKYLFLKCFALLVFVPLLFFVSPFEFEWSILNVLLILGVVFTIVGGLFGATEVIKKTSPYENMVLSTLTVPIIYLIDILIGSEQFAWMQTTAIVVILIGVFLLGSTHIANVKFRWNLILMLGSGTAKGYLLYFLLQTVSTSAYLLVAYAVATILMLLFFRKQIGTIKSDEWKWGFVTQLFGVFGLFFNALLVQESVTLYALRGPLLLVLTVMISFFVKDTHISKQPTLKNIVAICLTILGVISFVIL